MGDPVATGIELLAASTRFRRTSRPVRAPADVAEAAAERIRRERPDAVLFNGPTLVRTSVDTDGTWVLAESDYFTFLASQQGTRPRVAPLYASSLAVTADGYALLHLQNASNLLGAGTIGPSGGGSAEPADLLGLSAGSVVDLARTAAERELREERGLDGVPVVTHPFAWWAFSGRGSVVLLCTSHIACPVAALPDGTGEGGAVAVRMGGTVPQDNLARIEAAVEGHAWGLEPTLGAMLTAIRGSLLPADPRHPALGPLRP